MVLHRARWLVRVRPDERIVLIFTRKLADDLVNSLKSAGPKELQAGFRTAGWRHGG